MRVELQPAFLLHSRKISDSRLLVEFLTQEHGVVGAVARAPSKKKSPFTLFCPSLISWLGDKPLKTLIDYEARSSVYAPLTGISLYCGFYLNELLQRLMQKGDHCDSIYECYSRALNELAEGHTPAPILRKFELLLLEHLGYCVDFFADAKSGISVQADKYYHLDIQLGFYEQSQFDQSRFDRHHRSHTIYSGAAILALANRDFENTAHQNEMKQLLRTLLKPLLGNKPLKSRELFV